MTDPYQARYELHQARKRDILIEIMKERHSHRRFAQKDIPASVTEELLSVVDYCPSSCDRFGVKATVVMSRDEKALLSGVLVGGVGWLHRAPLVVLLFADPLAYKANDEIQYNSYLDAGIIAQQIMLRATSMDLGSCFVNPQIRPMNKEHFLDVFASCSDAVYCGAIAIGYPHEES